MLFIARLFVGFSNGWIMAVMQIYFAEISSIKIRGSISVLTMVVSKGGILFMYVIGLYLSISEVGWLTVSFPFAFLLLFVWCPESPYYLLAAKKHIEAQSSLVRLRGHGDIQSELNEMHTLVKLNQLSRPTFRELISAQNRRSLWILVSLGVISQLNGSTSIMSYAEMLFDQIGSDFASGYTTIILGVVQLVSSVCGSVFIDKLGRRRIMLVSIVSTTVCNCSLAVYFLLQKYYDLSWWTWFAIADVMILTAVAVFGLVIMPMVILGEIFPKHLKGVAAIALVMTNGIVAFVIAKVFQIVVDSYGYDVIFGVFTIVCFVYTPFVWYMLPETKGKSFQTILDELHARSLRR